MNVDLYERMWMWAATLMIVLFMTIIGVSTFAQGQHPPSHVETIDPSKVFTDPRFSAIGQPTPLPDGTIEVQMAAIMNRWPTAPRPCVPITMSSIPCSRA